MVWMFLDALFECGIIHFWKYLIFQNVVCDICLKFEKHFSPPDLKCIVLCQIFVIFEEVLLKFCLTYDNEHAFSDCK